METSKVLLIILDGWGLAPSWGGNAIETAAKPNMDNFWRKYPHTILQAAEEAVGLPIHESGNSEVGHLNIGCGEIVRQNLPGISQSIKDGSFFKNEILLSAIAHAQKNSSNIHLIGLVSDGGVHSHTDHLFALLDLLKQKRFPRVYIHMITDGRDTDPMKALSFLEELETKIRQIKIGKIESIMGRYYAMDRDNRWDRVQKAYDVLTSGVGEKSEKGGKAIAESYRKGVYDEFIVPKVLETEQSPFVPIAQNDAVIFFNFRADRTREMTAALTEEKFRGFGRRKVIKDLYFATFSYSEAYEGQLPIHPVFKEPNQTAPLALVLSRAGKKQYHLAETEKYAHVTYFFDGGKDQPFPLETRELIPSAKVATYDLKPEMSANRITDTLLDRYRDFDFCVVNFANADMVGHTGSLRAAVKAVEDLDECLGKIVKDVLAQKWTIMITADHGNAEQMINPNTGEPHTEHTINPVPFILISVYPAFQNPLRTEGQDGLKLSDIAPTVLKAMGLDQPKEMTGKSLIN